MWVPLWVRPRGLRVAVLGGGGLGERRARLFAEAGARVRVYALEFTEELRDMASRGLVELVEADLSRDDHLRAAVEWADLVVVAVPEPVAGRAARAALEAGRLVNDGVDAGRGNVIVPYRGSTSYGIHLAATSLGSAGPPARRALSWCVEQLEASPYFRALHLVFTALRACLRELAPGDPAGRVQAMLAADGDPAVHRLAGEGRLLEAVEEAARAAARVFEDRGEPGEDDIVACLKDRLAPSAAEPIEEPRSPSGTHD